MPYACSTMSYRASQEFTVRWTDGFTWKAEAATFDRVTRALAALRDVIVGLAPVLARWESLAAGGSELRVDDFAPTEADRAVLTAALARALDDARRYNDKHGALAESLAGRILTQLQQREDGAAVWAIEVHRGWADLQGTWDAVRRGASFLFWPDADAKVPPLGAIRPAPGRKGAANDDEEPAEPVDPAKPA